MSDYRVEPNGLSVYANMVELARKDQIIAELVAALERMDDHFRMFPDEMDQPGSVFAQARAALAKAKGETP
jgi:hypothetical protein